MPHVDSRENKEVFTGPPVDTQSIRMRIEAE